MPKRNSNNPLLGVNALLEQADLLLKQKKKELKGCKKCKKISPIWAVGKCKECFYEDRKPKEPTEIGKTWESTNGLWYIYVLQDGKKIPKLLHRHTVEEFIGRSLKRSEQVKFKSEDKSNCDISNLILVSDDGIDFNQLTCKHCGEKLI